MWQLQTVHGGGGPSLSCRFFDVPETDTQISVIYCWDYITSGVKCRLQHESKYGNTHSHTDSIYLIHARDDNDSCAFGAGPVVGGGDDEDDDMPHRDLLMWYMSLLIYDCYGICIFTDWQCIIMDFDWLKCVKDCDFLK